MKRWMVVLAAMLVPGAACAQDALPGWPGLDTSALPRVRVLDEEGTIAVGALLRLDPDSLVILVDGSERRFEAARVRRIDARGDSLRNGTILGAIVGSLFGIIGAGISDCSGDDPGGSCPGVRAGILLVSAGVYTAVGTAIDALIVGRTTVYVAPASRPSAARRRSTTMQAAHVEGAALNLRVSW